MERWGEKRLGGIFVDDRVVIGLLHLVVVRLRQEKRRDWGMWPRGSGCIWRLAVAGSTARAVEHLNRFILLLRKEIIGMKRVGTITGRR